ncbi:MAG: GMC family oxidoreductase N-terminal domain-containing protein [Sphingomonadales bacterium]|nr:GMC family oxidoreductase N-terminal domain-containing protein [Sphingomonadales bacterium]
MQADFIIIGGGSAGCVLANRLSADPSCRVVLVEAGGTGESFFVSMPAGWGKTTNEPGHNWHYTSSPEPALNGRKMPVPRGKGLGGSSNINGLLYVRGQQQDYDSWSNLGALGWGWADVAPYFRKGERWAGGGNALRGDSGALQVEEFGLRDPTSEAVLQAFAEIGVPPNPDYNGEDQFGAFHYQVTVQGGKRCSAADAFLRPVIGRSNLHVITGAQCRRILFEGKRATGVEIQTQNGVEQISATREVILSAGAYHSPQILMLSGIGPGSHLREQGISVLHDNPSVGNNLQDHLILTMSWALKSGQYSYNSELGGAKLLWNVLRYLATKSGPMTTPAAQTGAFVKSHPALDRPDIQFHCLPVCGDVMAATEGRKGSLSPFPGLTLAPCILRPESRGTVRLAGPDPLAVPDIVHNYLGDESDVRLSVRAMEMARELAAAPSLVRIIEREVYPGPEANTAEELIAYVRNAGSTGYHPVGTCRMGIDDAAVLDPQLRVKGVAGLRVADASIMPRLISGNTNAAAIMIGEKAADMILNPA